MGWYFTRKPAETDLYSFFSREFNGKYNRVLKVMKVNQVAYIAIKNTKDKEKTRVFAMVCLLDSNKNYNFGYKPMDETMLPYANECPFAVLNLLTPPLNEYAKEWRKDCFKNINKEAAEMLRKKWSM